MSAGDYLHRDSVVHRMGAGAKILVLLVVGTALFWNTSLWGTLAVLVVALLGCVLSRIPAGHVAGPMRSSLWLIVVLFLFQAVAVDLPSAAVVTLRLVDLLLLSVLLTLTTTTGAMIATLEKATRWTRRFGGDPGKLSLGIALAIRFVPLIADITAEVREAQAARGLDNNVIAVALPVVTRTLMMADHIADAIDARS